MIGFIVIALIGIGILYYVAKVLEPQDIPDGEWNEYGKY